MCLPGSAVSTFLECFPTFSGKPSLVSSLERAILRVVDFILGSYVCGVAPCWVAVLACYLARPKSSLSLLMGSQRIVILFPFLCSALIDL